MNDLPRAQRHLDNLRKLVTPTGLFLASSQSVQTGYDKAWLRDNVYEALAFEYAGEWDVVRKTYHTLLDIFDKHIDKINWAVTNKPFESWQFIHARYNPETLEEFWESWGNKQHDAVGAVLFKLADFEAKGNSVLRNEKDRRTVQTLIYYICNVEYWHDADSGMWEENEEIHASSIGAVVAALKKWQEVGGMDVDQDAIDRGEAALQALLPRESEAKFTDLALLSLIYPYNVVSPDMAREILTNLEYHLAKDKGVMRYKFDAYYNRNPDGYSEEAEWCFGLSWLAIAYKQLGDNAKAREYLQRATNTITKEGKIPELYLSHTDEANENTPLGWSESMYVVALYEVES
ncbi:MAG TPA: glycoside hydrolase family 15 protein [Candidatus Saccharimonadales bacterium]|jgi:phosphorylase kinase alpha/beta subunit|nr:glycoside hydrolase family 15 protein [Candidatus Saccharimonadales bacterium]